MATNFPTSLDSLTNPTSSDTLDSPSHSGQHANLNDAVEALEAKVGADSSAVTTSLDYKVHNTLAPLASPTFTGTPAAPTAASGTSTTQVATTAFVETEAVLKYGGGLETVETATLSTTKTIDLSSGNIKNYTLGASCTFTFPTATAGASFVMVLAQDGTGSRTTTWPSSSTLKWAAGSAPTLSTAASKVDILTFLSVNSVWYGFLGGLAFA